MKDLAHQVGSGKTWTKFQAHFIEAQANLRERQQPSWQGGYSTGTAHNAIKISMAFANLEQVTAEDRAVIINLTTSNSTLTEQVVLYTNRLSTKEVDNMELQTSIKKLQG